jgi:hypothetical protein
VLAVGAMTPQQFIKKWKPVALTERATAQSHFIVSFPKIISAHTDDAGRTEWAWRQWFRIAGARHSGVSLSNDKCVRVLL